MAGESAGDVARRQREKAERLRRSAERWERGAEGERITAAALNSLPSVEWTVFHDLCWPGRPYANVDHVVVGPPGVFVVDSKNWSGRIDVVDDVLRQNGRRREKEVAAVAEAALAVAQLSDQVTPHQVSPVLCFVRPEPISGRARDVMLCSTVNVREMLMTRPAVLDAAVRRRVCSELDASFRAAGGRPVARRPRGPARPTPTRPRQAARRRSPVTRVAVPLVVLMAVLAFVASPMPRVFGEWFVDRVASSAQAGDESKPLGPGLTRASVVGTWAGTYRCGQDASGHLVIRPDESSAGAVTAVFRFGPAARGASAATGTYRLAGEVSDGVLVLDPTGWVKRPAGYSMVGFQALLTEKRPRTLTGDVRGACEGFSFARQ